MILALGQRAKPEGLTMGSDGTKGGPADVTTASGAQKNRGLAPPTPAEEKKTAEELAAMIRQDLSKMDGCPARGVTVTVYGLDPWNSMLTFGVDAGPVPNKVDLQSFCDIITERLKRLYGVRAWLSPAAIERSPSPFGAEDLTCF
jgi:hypothetical protein